MGFPPTTTETQQQQMRCHHPFGTKDNVQSFHVTEMLFAPKHEDPKGLHDQWSRQIIYSAIKKTELAETKGNGIPSNNH